jgi:hypothetical protein
MTLLVQKYNTNSMKEYLKFLSLRCVRERLAFYDKCNVVELRKLIIRNASVVKKNYEHALMRGFL